MAHIKEPDGVDFVVDPTPLTASERKRISEIIAYYKITGRKKKQKTAKQKNTSSAVKKKKAA